MVGFSCIQMGLIAILSQLCQFPGPLGQFSPSLGIQTESGADNLGNLISIQISGAIVPEQAFSDRLHNTRQD